MLTALLLALAATPTVTVTPPPGLVLVRVPGPAAFEKTQQRLYEELTLLLDSFMILSTPVEATDFAKLSLADQLQVVLPLSRANDAVAVVWLAEPVPGQLMLHLVALGTGRTLVRTIELDRKSRSEAALALMLRELLGTAFLFEPPSAVVPEVRSVITGVREQLPEATAPPAKPVPVAPPEPPPPPPRAALAVTALLEAGVAGQSGTASRFGGGLAASWRFSLLALGLEADVVALRAHPSPSAWLTSLSVPLLVTGALKFDAGPLQLGPRVAAGAEVGWTTVGSSTAFSSGALALGGLEATAGSPSLRLLLRAEVGWRSRTVELLGDRGEFPLWRLASVMVRAQVGMSWEGF